ncbi:hypothetical protein [Chromohalobacter japonicus]|uniref:hypothetical protein n=1 Tax=Chromohalobacter japonicus TaxID=223900 RepID=UPI000A9ECDD8|nr:hypothetical protein [Chromohalobacter japonicus]
MHSGNKGTLSFDMRVPLFSAIIALSIFSLSVQESGVLRNIVVSCVLIFGVLFSILNRSIIFFRGIYFSYLLSVFLSATMYLILSYFLGESVQASKLIFLFVTAVVALVLYEDGGVYSKRYHSILRVVVYFLLFGYLFFNIGVENYFDGSRNTWSFVFVPLFGVLFFLHHLHGQKFSFILVCAVFALCVITQGRSGILSGFLMLLAYWFNLVGSDSSIIRRFSFFSVSVAMFFTAICFFALNGYFDYFATKGLGGSHRQAIIFNYIGSLDFVTFFSGLELVPGSFFEEYSFNLHNSFLYFHARFGFLAIFFGFLILFSLIKELFLGKLYLFLVMVSIVFRFSTDSGWEFNLIALHMIALHGLKSLAIDNKSFSANLK